MSIHEQLVSEADYQTNQHKAGAPIVQCIALLNRAAAHIAEQDKHIAVLREECEASRDPKLNSEHRYIGLCPHCVSSSRLVAVRSATDAVGALNEP